jgi:acetyl-CoA C-acetyltransferase
VNKPGLAVYAAEPHGGPLLLGDLAAEADRATPRLEVVGGYRGPARVAAYTVAYDAQSEPAKCTIIADTPDGRRCMASCEDAGLARGATQQELIGTTVRVDGVRFSVR